MTSLSTLFKSAGAMTGAHVEHDDATTQWIRQGNRVLLGLLAAIAVLSFVSISGAVVAPGVINVENNYKTVQHLDGGIVSKILVRNGDRVSEGDLVVKLDDTAARTTFSAINARARDLLIQQARLEAERDRKDDVTLPAEIAATADEPATRQLIATQLSLFKARRQSHNGEIAVLKQRHIQLLEERKSAVLQLASRRKEAALNKQELDSLRPLRAKGYVNQQRILPIERDGVRLEGEVGRLNAELAKVNSALAEAELKIRQSEKDLTQQIVDELRKVQAQVAEVLEQRTALADKLKRTEIRAPRAGRINALAVHTIGGVVAPGATVMQVVPEGERLIIDAQLQPVDIDKVRLGQAAHVRFPAFNARSTPRLVASVLSISPAQITDNQGRSHFQVQVALADGELARLGPGHQLVPGMPADVFIETDSRTILSYFVKPLTDILARTFRES
ncbi:MAG: HlyD family type I secretion periplasmic adaptor subunit [Hyphomicrobiaceae bacterium]